MLSDSAAIEPASRSPAGPARTAEDCCGNRFGDRLARVVGVHGDLVQDHRPLGVDVGARISELLIMSVSTSTASSASPCSTRA